MVSVNWFERVVGAVTGHTRVAIAVMVVLTVALGAGAGQVSESSSLDQFQTDSPEAQKLDYIDSNFTTGEENVTRVQIIVQAQEGGNVLSKPALLDVLRFQEQIKNDPTVNATLTENGSITGIANTVATAARGQELQERVTTLNETGERLAQAIGGLVQNPAADPGSQFDQLSGELAVDLDSEDRAIFVETTEAARNATSRAEISETVRSGVEQMLGQEYAQVQRQLGQLQNASIQDQIDTLNDMEPAEVEAVVGQLLGENGDDMAGTVVRVTLDDGTVLSGVLVAVPSTQRSEVGL